MRVAQRRVGAIVAEEEDQRVLGDSESFEMVEQVAERPIHPLDQRREGLRRGGLARVLVVRGEAWIAVERRVDRVLGEVEEERLLRPDGLGDVRLRLDREGL